MDKSSPLQGHDPLSSEETLDQLTKPKPGWVKFNEENGSNAGKESSEVEIEMPQESRASSSSIKNRSPLPIPDDETLAVVVSDQNAHPAVIETSVAIVPSVQIQSPSKATTVTSRPNSNPPISSPQHGAASTNSTTSSNQLNNNAKKDKPSTFINLSNLDNVELRNSQPNLTSVGGASTTTTGLNGRDNAPRRSGFTNGDEIVSILPMNTRFPWVTPAVFRPELVPEELMNECLTLTVEEFVHIMEMLTTDFRFNLYIICYKRLLASWLATAFFVLLIILFSGIGGVGLFALGITWLIVNAMAVFLCMYIKIKINKGLERCMARVNKLLIKHKIIVGVDDRGKLSCHKIQLCFMYFDPTDCIKRLAQVVEASSDRSNLYRHLDVTDVDIVITGANSRRIPQAQHEALFLRYIQSWMKDYIRELATSPNSTTQPPSPSHIPARQNCPCQYTVEMLKEKRDAGGFKNCFAIFGSSQPIDSQVTRAQLQV